MSILKHLNLYYENKLNMQSTGIIIDKLYDYFLRILSKTSSSNFILILNNNFKSSLVEPILNLSISFFWITN